MSKIEINPEFQRGDIVTMKSMAEYPEEGRPQRMEVRFWQAVGDYGERVDILYWVRLLWHAGKVAWNLRGEQCFSAGTRLATGEVPVAEEELCLYVPPREAAEEKPCE